MEDETEAQQDRAGKAADLVRRYGVTTNAETILHLQEEGARRLVPSVFIFALAELCLTEQQVCSVVEEARWDKERLYLYPDAKAVLDALKGRHFLGIIANQSPGTERRLKRYGIREYFDLVFASAEFGLAKPDPRIFQCAREAAGCGAEHAWMIGDRLDNDIRPANLAGWHTVRILQGYNVCQHPRDVHDEPDHTVSRLTDLLPILGHQRKTETEPQMDSNSLK